MQLVIEHPGKLDLQPILPRRQDFRKAQHGLLVVSVLLRAAMEHHAVGAPDGDRLDRQLRSVKDDLAHRLAHVDGNLDLASETPLDQVRG